MDYANKTHVVCDSIERELNSVGVFDRDIMEMDDQTIENLNAGGAYSVSIVYANEEKDGSLAEMSMDEVDDLIEENYSDEIASATKKSFWDFFQIRPAVASAASTGWKTSPSGKVRQLLYITQDKKGGNVHVDYKVHWVEEAYYRDNDVIGISLTNMFPVTDTWKGTHTYTVRDLMLSNGKVYKTSESKTLKKANTISTTTGMATDIDLYSSRSKLNAINASGSVRETIMNEIIYIQFDCKVVGGNGTVGACGSYYHAKGKFVSNPSISISSDGLSVGVSTSYQKYYSIIKHNPALSFQYK